tara:strand:+ start:69 stop:518 length:450 start_codon:yes stop_codon:yes gene_type:complete
MKTLIRTTKIGLFFTLALMYGCASINSAPPEQDIAAKKFTKNPETSQVYVYRNETLGAALSMPVTVDGKLAGTTGPKSFFKFDLPAGNHTLTSQGSKSILDIETQNGELYFIWQEVKMGAFSGGSELQVVDEAKGKKGVSACKLIQSNI